MDGLESSKYLRFDEIPKWYYDGSISDRGEWEEKLVDFMIANSKEEKNNKITFSEDIPFGPFNSMEVNGESDEKMNELIFSSGKEESKKETMREKKRKDNDIYVCFPLREFLYNKGIPIPSKEVDREFYLRERLSSIERKNLLELLDLVSHEVRPGSFLDVPFGIFGVGTSIYPEEYYFDLQNNKFAGKSLETKVIEKATSFGDLFDEEEIESYTKYVELCYNQSEAWDEKLKPKTKKQFEEYQKRKQKRYTKEKTIREILENKGEDLDFAICLEENLVTSPLRNYSTDKSRIWRKEKDINLVKRRFINTLEKNNFVFEEEIENLEGHDYSINFEGDFIRNKEIAPNTCRYDTIRVIPKKGRSMHFYFYNQDYDLKLKQEIIYNHLPFVQLGRKMDRKFGYSGVIDLKAAIENGEKTGVYENPLVLKWK